jgi:DNA-directed RNA polymerase subunit H (RpoH/RPB5)
MHKYFSIEISKGPLCSKHVILSNNEVKDLCSRELIIHPLSLPSISINDPQNIWIGGELGEVIKILSISEITGETIRYRIVSPDSGKMINIQKLKKSIQDNDDAQTLEDESNNTNAVNQKTEQPNKISNDITSNEKNKDTKEDLSEYIDDISDDEGSDYD